MINEQERELLKISPTMAEKLAKLNLKTAWDLVLHLPLRYEDETHLTPMADIRIGEQCMVAGEVKHQEVIIRHRRQLVVRLEDDGGHVLFLRFIHFYPSQQKQLEVGKKVHVVGEVRAGFWGMEMIHPKIYDAEKKSLSETLTPIYPTVSGLNQSTLRRIIATALEQIDLQDSLPETIINKLNLPSFADAVRILHAPPPEYSQSQLNNGSFPAWQRLKFDELLAQQLSMQLARKMRVASSAIPLSGDASLCNQLLNQLPFSLTSAQEKCYREIKNDMKQSHPMHRLLQGDVGSGKTIVATLAGLTALEAGFQVAMMAPTEILAEQHYNKLSQWLKPLNISVLHLCGSLKKKEKEQIKQAISNGEARFIVGTHALFQDDVVFERLGLAIVDEQHRFGVAQRLALKNKGQSIHQLMMSATPIPRTLAMSFFADLDVSVIDSLPPNRTPITTRLINSVRRNDVENYVRKIVAQGRQAYWVCPLIEESETLQLKTATETFDTLQQTFPELSIGLVHGRMKAAEKAEVMSKFVSGSLSILVATTVIEVGVDVPNAVLMVIEHAERMGLSQLHQLRGRVGRGSGKSTCVLMFAEPLSEIAKARLKIIYENTDGFEIARQDLNLRGPGEFLGARQSGVPLLRFANLQEDLHLLESARDYATQMIRENSPYIQTHLMRWLPNREEYLSV
ncbi:MAG: ATP-dependent DNA helicase RecG [Neisseriaceae bacterium]|nr:ATP-dependent DNA helicase RecG [Neisseriaceae bacterium]